MFTGIIQGQGEISSLRKTGAECRLAIRPLFTLPDVIDVSDSSAFAAFTNSPSLESAGI